MLTWIHTLDPGPHAGRLKLGPLWCLDRKAGANHLPGHSHRNHSFGWSEVPLFPSNGRSKASRNMFFCQNPIPTVFACLVGMQMVDSMCEELEAEEAEVEEVEETSGPDGQNGQDCRQRKQGCAPPAKALRGWGMFVIFSRDSPFQTLRWTRRSLVTC